MTSIRFRQVKHAQKESFLLREISSLFLRICIDDVRLNGVYISRVKLSPDRGRCTIFLQDYNGREALEGKMRTIIMYKPSLRSAIAKALQSRYTPELSFVYDEAFEKQRSVDELIDRLKDEESNVLDAHSELSEDNEDSDL